MKTRFTPFRHWLGALLLSLWPALSPAHPTPDGLVVFGDSLSDPGNAYLLLGTALTPPYATLDALLVPDAPYAIGGHHFSNGATWIEQFARSLELQADAGPAFSGRPGRSNYAVGGARARNSGSGVDLTDQVNLYLARVSGQADSERLYVIEFGGNDVRDAIAALALDPTGGASADIVGAALQAVADNLLSLYASGARSFLVSNSPDLSLTPAIRTLDRLQPGSGMAAAIISAQYNAGLAGLIAQLGLQLPDASLQQLDIYRLLGDVASDPQKYRMANTTEACVMNQPPFSCAHPDRYLFWDGIHPTRAGHGLFADLASETLGLRERGHESLQECAQGKRTEAASCR